MVALWLGKVKGHERRRGVTQPRTFGRCSVRVCLDSGVFGLSCTDPSKGSPVLEVCLFDTIWNSINALALFDSASLRARFYCPAEEISASEYVN